MQDKTANTPTVLEASRPASSDKSRHTRNFIFIFIAALFILTTYYTAFNPIEAFLSQGEFWRFITQDFFPPKLDNPAALLESILQTFAMALLSSGISAVLAFVIAFFGSSALCGIPYIPAVVRGIASIMRNIPPLVWAFILVMALGIGTHVGILALVIATLSFLIRAYIETMEEAAEESMEALKSCGANTPQLLFQSIVPASIPGYIAWLLYCVETNVRASTILGMVGAGGIGMLLTGYIKQYQYQSACTAILAVAVVIIGVNWLTEFLRKKVLD